MRNLKGKAKRVCDAVAAGESVQSGCRRARVSRTTFYRWASARADVLAMYQQACRQRLDVVEKELAKVKEEIAEIQASVPAVRPKGGLPLGVCLRAISDMRVPDSVWKKLTPRISRAGYQRMRQRMRERLELPRARFDVLRLERARLLGRLKRSLA